MKLLLAVVAITLIPSLAHAWWWSSDSPTPYWDGLRTTFAADAFNPFNREPAGYAKVPRNISEANTMGWIPMSTSCENNGLFFGLQYCRSYNGVHDTSVTALFDKNGIIVGIQMNIAVVEAKNNSNTYKFDEIPMFLRNTVNGVDSYTLTAYFTNPSTICTTGRAATALTVNGTADMVYFQNGTNPSQIFSPPLDRAVALTQGWSNNKCFIGMGVHNWFQQEKFQETNCNYILPVFLLYNEDDDLLGFGFQHVGHSTSPSKRFEYPPDVAVGMIVGGNKTTYQCLLDHAKIQDITTLHVYLIDSPKTCVSCL